MPTLKNPKHEHFATLIAQGVNQSEAAKRVGFSEGRAHVTGSNLVRRSKVAARIKELRVRVADQCVRSTGITKAWVIDELVDNLRKCKQDTPVLDRKGNPTGTYVFQAMAANRALELIGKELGMFTDRIEHSASGDMMERLISARRRLSPDSQPALPAPIEVEVEPISEPASSEPDDASEP